MRYKVFGKRTGLRVSELGDTEPSRTRRGACSTAMSKPAEISSTPWSGRHAASFTQKIRNELDSGLRILFHDPVAGLGDDSP